MDITRPIEKPFGISVFGSSIMRTEPDIATLMFVVSRLAKTPREAFHEARIASQKVRSYLANEGIPDVSSSRVSLTQTFQYTGGEHKFVGYTARVSFHVLLHDLDKMENIISGVVDAGANEINAVKLQTSKLKEIRSEARRRAVEAAHEKALNYCNAANVSLGSVIHIEDVNPDKLQGVTEGHVARQAQADDEGETNPFEPGSIIVGAAVMMAYKIGE